MAGSAIQYFLRGVTELRSKVIFQLSARAGDDALGVGAAGEFAFLFMALIDDISRVRFRLSFWGITNDRAESEEERYSSASPKYDLAKGSHAYLPINKKPGAWPGYCHQRTEDQKTRPNTTISFSCIS